MSAHESVDLTGASETMLLTLCARADTVSAHPRFEDWTAVDLVSRLDYDFSAARRDRLMSDGVVVRTLAFDPLVAGYLATHPGCTVVNIACGLDTRFQRLDDGRVTWYDLDLPEGHRHAPTTAGGGGAESHDRRLRPRPDTGRTS